MDYENADTTKNSTANQGCKASYTTPKNKQAVTTKVSPSATGEMASGASNYDMGPKGGKKSGE